MIEVPWYAILFTWISGFVLGELAGEKMAAKDRQAVPGPRSGDAGPTETGK